MLNDGLVDDDMVDELLDESSKQAKDCIDSDDEFLGIPRMGQEWRPASIRVLLCRRRS